ncbi:hypothetical protein OFM39_36535, partial [Escherichia coli]|nr:hypothetical protein [Escherichia coli]
VVPKVTPLRRLAHFLQRERVVAEVHEDYSLKGREDSVTVNFNSVTNPAMEVVTTAMKKEILTLRSGPL